MLPQIGLSFVSWHKTPGSLSGGWALKSKSCTPIIFNAFVDDHVSGQPLIRKRSDLSHRYEERFNFFLSVASHSRVFFRGWS